MSLNTGARASFGLQAHSCTVSACVCAKRATESLNQQHDDERATSYIYTFRRQCTEWQTTHTYIAAYKRISHRLRAVRLQNAGVQHHTAIHVYTTYYDVNIYARRLYAVVRVI